MAKSFNLTLELPQPVVKVAVAFYDDAEKQKLLKYYTFELAGQIQYSDTGVLFGVLPTSEDQ